MGQGHIFGSVCSTARHQAWQLGGPSKCGGGLFLFNGKSAECGCPDGVGQAHSRGLGLKQAALGHMEVAERKALENFL